MVGEGGVEGEEWRVRIGWVRRGEGGVEGEEWRVRSGG